MSRKAFLGCSVLFLQNVFIFKLSHGDVKAMFLLYPSIPNPCASAFVCGWGWHSLINSQVFEQPKSCNLLLPILEQTDIFSLLLLETSMGKINCLQPGSEEFRIISTD